MYFLISNNSVFRFESTNYSREQKKFSLRIFSVEYIEINESFPSRRSIIARTEWSARVATFPIQNSSRRGENSDKREREREISRKFRSGRERRGHERSRRRKGGEFSNRRRTNENYMRNPFPRGNGFSIGSCEIPGVLTRAIYHARSVFAYVVKGPCVAYALGHRRSRVPFEIRVFANTPHTHTRARARTPFPPLVSPYLFISALLSSHPRREKSPSRTPSSSPLLRIFYRPT